MRRAVLFVMMVLALLALPLAASAQTTTTEPYSGGDVTETTIAPRIEVLANGLTATFTAVGAGGDCTWDFGDASTGTGNPTTHTYSAEGDYTVGVTCGTIVLARTLQVGADLTLTGIDVLPYLLGAFALILIGGLVVLANRRGKTAN